MILDVTVGARKLYHGWDKNLGDELIGIDIRKGDFSIEDEHHWAKAEVIIHPTVLADMRWLPFRENIFDCIIFDPPHMECGLTSWLGKYYGRWTQSESIQITRKANEEFKRVLRPRGLLVLKVMPKQFRTYEAVLKNFVFFLPITTYRARGAYGKEFRKQEGALWAIAQAKQLDFLKSKGDLEVNVAL